jgi:hypothetical protein
MSTERMLIKAMQEQPIFLLPVLFLVLLAGWGLARLLHAPQANFQ